MKRQFYLKMVSKNNNNCFKNIPAMPWKFNFQHFEACRKIKLAACNVHQAFIKDASVKLQPKSFTLKYPSTSTNEISCNFMNTLPLNVDLIS